MHELYSRRVLFSDVVLLAAVLLVSSATLARKSAESPDPASAAAVASRPAEVRPAAGRESVQADSRAVSVTETARRLGARFTLVQNNGSAGGPGSRTPGEEEAGRVRSRVE